MGLTDNKRLMPSIYLNSGTGSSSGGNAFSDGPRGINLSGGTDPCSERGNLLIKRPSGRFCLPTISGPQKGWWVPPSSLNKYILEEHFKMEGFHMVRDLVRQGDWLAKIDLKDAYFLILAHPCHQKFLQFTWKESLYQFQCLPFGLSCTPECLRK